MKKISREDWINYTIGSLFYVLVGIGLWFWFVGDMVKYAFADERERCRISLENRNDPDAYCDENNEIASKREFAEKKAQERENVRRAKLTPKQKCEEDKPEPSAEDDLGGGFYICREDGSLRYISEKEIRDDVYGVSGGRCQDVTSYDYNWDNDMLCTRPDGSQFYTNYAGAEAYENSQ